MKQHHLLNLWSALLPLLFSSDSLQTLKYSRKIVFARCNQLRRCSRHLTFLFFPNLHYSWKTKKKEKSYLSTNRNQLAEYTYGSLNSIFLWIGLSKMIKPYISLYCHEKEYFHNNTGTSSVDVNQLTTLLIGFLCLEERNSIFKFNFYKGRYTL
jgi:hypothetical protein